MPVFAIFGLTKKSMFSRVKVAQEEGYSSLTKIFRSATGERGLVATRSRSRENNTQLFSNTLAPLRYPDGLRSNANPSPREFARRADSRASDCDIKINTIHEGWCSFLWRRKRDSNPRGFWPNGFQDRLVVTASISLRMKFY